MREPNDVGQNGFDLPPGLFKPSGMDSVPENPPPEPSAVTPAPPRLAPDPPSRLGRRKTWWEKLLAVLGAIGAAVAKFFAQIKLLLIPILKFGLPVLKTGGTMLLSMWVYAQLYGWWFGVGFVILIFIHECGHLIAAKIFGLKVSAPMFIPFMGAVILLKESPRNAWVEAWTGITGPILGSVGALGSELIYLATGNPMYQALAYTGFFLNLFNLAPISPLDGGRVVTALSPWLWVAGYVIMGLFAINHLSFILIIIMVAGLPRLFSLFRAKTDAQRRYFEVTATQRFCIATVYFGLIALLMLGMEQTFVQAG
jgi:Zn-dependent protease